VYIFYLSATITSHPANFLKPCYSNPHWLNLTGIDDSSMIFLEYLLPLVLSSSCATGESYSITVMSCKKGM
jgi:hypothetical protein